MIGLATGLLFSILHVQGSHAVDKVCSNDTLNGSYGFYRTGVTSLGQLAAVGFITFDGNGNHSGTQTQTKDGGKTFTDVTDPGGKYEVDSDCTGSLLDGSTPGTVLARLVVVDGGAGVYMLSVSNPGNGNAVYVVARKIQP